MNQQSGMENYLLTFVYFDFMITLIEDKTLTSYQTYENHLYKIDHDSCINAGVLPHVLRACKRPVGFSDPSV